MTYMKFKERVNQKVQEYGVYFIAEIGQNHQGSLKIAKELVDSLKGTGVAAIKTAKRDIDVCLSDLQKNALYDNPHSFGKTYYEHRKALELSKDDFLEFKDYAEKSGFDFISSFTDLPSLKFLDEIGIECIKIASQRLADFDLLKAAAETKLPTIISTGMSSISDVDEVVEIFSLTEKYLLQCTSTYPCPNNELNINVLNTYKSRYRGKIDGIGFSGHHTGIAADLAAFMLGSVIIERHYTLDRSMKGTDHAASLELRGVENILKYIHQIKESLGSMDKILLDSEKVALNKLRSDLINK